MSACCQIENDRKAPTAWGGRLRAIASWVLPGAVFVLVPKCPACIAAQVALWTGIGLSYTTAAYLRWVLLTVCIASLLCLVVIRLNCWGPFFVTSARGNEGANDESN